MAIDVFAKIGDIKGESRDDRHKDEIEVLSWSWGISRLGPSVEVGGASDKPIFADFTFTHAVDKASPMLMKACATGEHLKEAMLTARKAGRGQQEYLFIHMTEVIITSVTPSEAREETTPAETVSMQFAKVDLEYRTQKPDGSPDAGTHFKYDIKANKEG